MIHPFSLKEIGKRNGRINLTLSDIKKSVENCLMARDFEEGSASFNRQVMSSLFGSAKLSGQEYERISKDIKKILKEKERKEGESVVKERKRKTEQCKKDFKEEIDRAGFKNYEEFENHLTIR